MKMMVMMKLMMYKTTMKLMMMTMTLTMTTKLLMNTMMTTRTMKLVMTIYSCCDDNDGVDKKDVNNKHYYL